MSARWWNRRSPLVFPFSNNNLEAIHGDYKIPVESNSQEHHFEKAGSCAGGRLANCCPDCGPETTLSPGGLCYRPIWFRTCYQPYLPRSLVGVMPACALCDIHKFCPVYGCRSSPWLSFAPLSHHPCPPGGQEEDTPVWAWGRPSNLCPTADPEMAQ